MLVRFTVARRYLLADLMIALGVGALLGSAWFLLDGIAYQRAQRAKFLQSAVSSSREDSGSKAVSIPVTAVEAGAVSGDVSVLGQLAIPSVDLDVIVGEGLDSPTLRRSIGHMPESAAPGEPGSVVLLGHRDTFFRPLRNLETGDVAELRTGTGTFRYKIDEITIVEPDEVELNLTTEKSEITLVTCYPFYFLGPSPQRFVARGHLVESRTD